MPRLSLALAAALLAIGGCASSTRNVAGTDEAGQPTASLPSSSQAEGTPIRVLDFTLAPLTVSLTGPAITLSVANDGPTVHNVTIRDSSGTVLAGTADLRAGEAETITTQISPATYDLICTLPGHESLGIKGTLTVVAP